MDDTNGTLMDRCRVWANTHTLGNIARVGVGASEELAGDVCRFVLAEAERITRERDELRAEVERLNAFEAAVVAYAAATHVLRGDDVGGYEAAWRDLCQADDAMLALVPKGPTL